MLSNNLFALVITFALALAWLRLNDYFAFRGWISSQLSRKIIHMGTGPIFVFCWLLFTRAASSRYMAALVPTTITVQFLLVGVGLIRDQAAVQAMSRTGNRREILKGPLYYGIVFILVTVIYWDTTPIGMVALMLMCGGDGMADVIGRRFGMHKLPWNPGKSWFGSLGMFLGGWIFSSLTIGIFIIFNIYSQSYSSYLIPISLIALAGTLVESLPIRDIDNITVPFTAILLGHLLF